MRDYRFVRYGNVGKQVALLLGTTPSGKLKARKWQENSKEWTGILYLPPSSLIGPATETDWLKRVKPETDLSRRLP